MCNDNEMRRYGFFSHPHDIRSGYPLQSLNSLFRILLERLYNTMINIISIIIIIFDTRKLCGRHFPKD